MRKRAEMRNHFVVVFVKQANTKTLTFYCLFEYVHSASIVFKLNYEGER